jgi:hypothetical protein
VQQFQPQKPQKPKITPYSLNLSDDLKRRLVEAAKKSGITQQDLIRQMLSFCLTQMDSKKENT